MALVPFRKDKYLDILITCSLSGQITAINSENGQILWRFQEKEGPFLNGSLSSAGVFKIGGENVQIMPTLDGRIYIYSHKSNLIQPLSITIEKLLQSTLSSASESVCGGTTIKTTKIDAETGKIVENLDESRKILLLKRISRKIAVFEAETGVEKWSLSTGELELSSTFNMGSENGSKIEKTIELRPPDGIVSRNDLDKNWTTDINGHIVKCWNLVGNHINEISLFNPSNIFTTAKNPNSNPILYMGTSNGYPFIIQSEKAKKIVEKQFLDEKNEKNVEEIGICEDSLTSLLNRSIKCSKFSNAPHRTKNLAIVFFNSKNSAPILIGSENLRSTSLHNSGDYGYLVVLEQRFLGLRTIFKVLSSKFAHYFKYIFSSLLKLYFIKNRPNFSVIIPKPASKILLFENSQKSIEPPAFESRFEKEFEIEKIIGSGGFGVVFKAKHRLDDISYAVKRIAVENTEKSRSRVKREAQTLAIFDHPGIIRYFYAWEEKPPKGWQKSRDQMLFLENSSSIEIPSTIGKSTVSSDGNNKYEQFSIGKGDFEEESDSDIEFYRENEENEENEEEIEQESQTCSTENNRQIEIFQNSSNSSPVYFYIVMQLCESRTLADWLTSENQRDLKIAKNWIRQLTEALCYLHANGYIHRDLKPGNIFFAISSTNSEKRLKLGDLGLATKKFENFGGKNQGGTRTYMAPEQLQNRQISQKIDIFSLGLISIELLIYFPTQMEKLAVFRDLQNGKCPELFQQFPAEISEFLGFLTNFDAEKRPEAEEILKSDFLN
ncbi:unnamed protein product [Caenorhabditis angaria]|uniref:PRKR-like endoplasmic reticulum kinase n=1 Tax=Caenorhabditis angaria TaxID=860376 RepID=A0A9P1I7E1_9PELO|nr:unnamed protein product [Caenorhabditis angaria]